MLELYVDAKGRGASDAEAMQSVAAGFSEEASAVLDGLIRYASKVSRRPTEGRERVALQGHVQPWEGLREEASRPTAPEGPGLAVQGLLRLKPEEPQPT